MNFGEAIASGFSNYVNFPSRAARSEYWYWVLFIVLAEVVTEIIDHAVIGMSVTTAIFALAVLLPGIAWRPAGCTTSTAPAGGCCSPSFPSSASSCC